MSKLEMEAKDGVQLAVTLRTLGTSSEMLSRHYADRRHQSHTSTQRVQHRLEKLESPSTSDNPPTVPASRVSKPMAHSSTSGKSPPPVPASRAKRATTDLKPMEAGPSTSGKNPPPVPASRAKRATTDLKPMGGPSTSGDDAIGKSNF